MTNAVRLRAVAIAILTLALTPEFTRAEVGRESAHRSVFLSLIGFIASAGKTKSG